MLFEDIAQKPETTLRSVFEFLGADSNVDLNLDGIPRNRSRRSRLVSPEPLMRWFARFMIEHDQAVLLHRIRKLGLKELLLNISTNEYRREPIRPETRERLRRLFHDDVRELEDLLERDLSAWRSVPRGASRTASAPPPSV